MQVKDFEQDMWEPLLVPRRTYTLLRKSMDKMQPLPNRVHSQLATRVQRNFRTFLLLLQVQVLVLII